MSTLDASIRAATERPSVSRTRALLADYRFTTAEWDSLVKYTHDEAEFGDNTYKWLAMHAHGRFAATGGQR